MDFATKHVLEVLTSDIHRPQYLGEPPMLSVKTIKGLDWGTHSLRFTSYKDVVVLAILFHHQDYLDGNAWRIVLDAKKRLFMVCTHIQWLDDLDPTFVTADFDEAMAITTAASSL